MKWIDIIDTLICLIASIALLYAAIKWSRADRP